MEIIRGLRLGEFDVLVGINLLREGLDLPEVSLVAILDADKEGFLRSTTSLIQTVGRAARNVHGQVIMYADQITRSMDIALQETNRRRAIQMDYNQKHNIAPRSVHKAVRDVIEATKVAEEKVAYRLTTESVKQLGPRERKDLIARLEKEMKDAARQLEFEHAANLRDLIIELRG